MFVKLSGDKWVNTGNVASISRETRIQDDVTRSDKTGAIINITVVQRVVYVVWFTGHENKMVLNETQGRELLAAVAAYDATRKHALSASVSPPAYTEVVRD